MYGKGLRQLSIATVVAIAVAFSLVFFYAPLDADHDGRHPVDDRVLAEQNHLAGC